MKRVIVTGAKGLIGQHAILPLIERGYEVHAITSPGSRTETVLPSGVALHAVDLLRADGVRELVQSVRPTHLLHLAWFTEHGRFWTSPSNLDWVAASLALLRAFREAGGQRVVMAGTCAEYDWGAEIQRESSTALRPSTLYGVAKNALREIAGEYSRQEGVAFAWGRIFFLYGPCESPARLVPTIIRSLLAGEPALLSHGEQVRDFMHTADVGGAFAALLDSSHEGAVNVASGRGVRVREVARLIGELLGRPELIRLGARPPAPQDPPSIVADASILRDTVGYRETYGLREGLETTIGWWRDQL